MSESVVIGFPASRADAISDDLIECFQGLGASITTRDIERPQFVNILEWALPAGVALWVTKSFFDAMLTKLGEEAGEAIVTALKNQFKKTKSEDERYYSHEELTEAKENIDEGKSASWEQALRGKGRQVSPLELNVNGYAFDDLAIQFRLVFPASLSDSDFEQAIELLRVDCETIFGKAIAIESPRFLPSEISKSDRIDLVYNHCNDCWETATEIVRRKTGGPGS